MEGSRKSQPRAVFRKFRGQRSREGQSSYGYGQLPGDAAGGGGEGSCSSDVAACFVSRVKLML